MWKCSTFPGQNQHFAHPIPWLRSSHQAWNYNVNYILWPNPSVLRAKIPLWPVWPSSQMCTALPTPLMPSNVNPKYKPSEIKFPYCSQGAPGSLTMDCSVSTSQTSRVGRVDGEHGRVEHVRQDLRSIKASMKHKEKKNKSFLTAQQSKQLFQASAKHSGTHGKEHCRQQWGMNLSHNRVLVILSCTWNSSQEIKSHFSPDLLLTSSEEPWFKSHPSKAHTISPC